MHIFTMIKDYRQLDLFGKKAFEKAIMEPPFRFSAEMPNEACFYYLVEGCSSTYTSSGKVKTMSSEGLVLRCGNYFNEYLASNNSSYCEAIAVHFYPDMLKMIYDKDFPDFLVNVEKIKPIRYEKVQTSALLKTYVDSLQFYFDNPQLVSEELLKLKIKELILLLAKTDKAEAVRSLIEGLFTPAEIDFKETIEANLYNNLTLEELAKLTNLSLSSFKREFARQYNTSPAKYIRRRKLEQAAKLLKGTELRISDIAFDCGFVDLAHFSKVFQREHGCSPSDYRLS